MYLKTRTNTPYLFQTEIEKEKLENLSKQIDSGTFPQLSDPHVAANLLKHYFRRLQEPIIPVDHFHPLLETQKIEEKNKRLAKLRACCDLLPEYNHAIVEALFALLSLVVSCEGESKMNGMNMAIIITPLILWHPDPQQNCANVKAAIDVVSQLILNADKMFRIRHLKSLDYQYTTIETVEETAHSGIFICEDKRTKLLCRVKAVRKGILDATDLENLSFYSNSFVSFRKKGGKLLKEKEIMLRIRHPQILALQAICESNELLYLVNEYAEVKISDLLTERNYFVENQARSVIRSLLRALSYLHSLQIIHRDVTAENIMLKSRSDFSSVKLTNLGYVKAFKRSQQTMCTVTNFDYMAAPEMLEDKMIGANCDMWSVGTLTYLLLCGGNPFDQSLPMKEKFQLILDAKFSFDAKEWESVSDDAKDFVSHLIRADAEKRLSAKDSFDHSWFAPMQKEFEKVAELITKKEPLVAQPTQPKVDFPVFGMPIDSLMELQGKGGYFPEVVRSCIMFIRPRVGAEGIFRLSVSSKVLDEIRSKIDSGEPYEFPDVYCAAALLKRYFREMPEPLIPFDKFDSFLETKEIEDVDLRIQKLRGLCDSLPQYNHALLEAFLGLLKLVESQKEENKMTARNLAVSVGPSLMWSLDLLANVSQQAVIPQVVEFLILNAEALFGIRDLTGLADRFEILEEVPGKMPGVVRYTCREKETGCLCAVRGLEKASVAEGDLDGLRESFNSISHMKRTSLEEKEGEKKVGERDLMFRIRHPGIVPLLGVAESAKRVFLVTEYLECNLESVLESVGLLSESDATVVIRQVLRALFYLHEVEKIAHRDIALSNIYFKKKGNFDGLKIGNFGYAKAFESSENPQMKTIVSLEGYFPPEFLSEEAYDGTKADIWRVGAMTYLLLSGKKPFDTDIPMASRIQLIQGGKVDFPAANWAHVSREARDFVLKLIHPDPATRLSAKEALDHDWIRLLDTKLAQKLKEEMPQHEKEEEEKVQVEKHDFSLQFVFQRVKCEHCGGTMWGVRNRVAKCSKCRKVYHTQCQSHASSSCPGVKK